MSSYVHIFVRSIHDDFVHLAEGSRNSYLYSLFGRIAPYERIANISAQKLNSLLTNLTEDEEDVRQSIATIEKQQSLIATFNNDISDKLAMAKDLEYDLQDNKARLEEISAARNFVNLLIDITETASYEHSSVSYKDDDEVTAESTEPLHPDRIIYVGIDCGLHPTIGDTDPSLK